MRKHLKTLIIIVVITGAAVWGFQHLQFFDRLPVAFSQTVAAATNEVRGQVQGGYRGGRGGENQDAAHQLPERRGQVRGGSTAGGNGFRGRGQGGGHNKTASLAGWVNVTAYLTIFTFFIMLTYYSELGIRAIMQHREACVSE
jgi:hypothetical protein